MWVFLRDGFFSAVENRDNAEQVIVRARCRKHAAALAAATGGKVEWTPDRDYCCRVVLSKSTWAEYLSRAALAIDYGNVKANLDGGDHAYHHAMMSCWAVMNDYQSEVEGVGLYVGETRLHHRR